MPSPTVRFLLGLAFAACGMIGMFAALDMGPLPARDINGPPWLGAVAGGVFLIGGVFIWAGDAANRHGWLGGLLAVLLLAAFAAIGNWIAFGAGARQCSGGLSGIPFLSVRVAEIECRVAFGMGALMLDGLLVWALGIGLRRLGLRGRSPAWIEKLGKGLLLVALAPILLVLVTIVIGKALIESIATFRRTGKWPRNEEFIARRKKQAESSL